MLIDARVLTGHFRIFEVVILPITTIISVREISLYII